MHLATANTAIMLTSYEDPLMADFVSELDSVNATADAAPGFVWRYIEEDDGAEVLDVFGSEKVLFNMSVWESAEALESWVYSGEHLAVVQKRAKWFEKPTNSPFVCWWIDEGHIPTVAEARSRLELLWKSGPSPDAFTFAKRFEPA